MFKRETRRQGERVDLGRVSSRTKGPDGIGVELTGKEFATGLADA